MSPAGINRPSASSRRWKRPGRDKDVKVTAIDAGPETLEIMAEPGSPFVANVAQQPHLIGQTSADNVARYFCRPETTGAKPLFRWFR
ncbi:sugar ABC transporter periplasmic sugar-binding protein [Klebsiella pneumoniae]|nr:sugar ABC transporter periplasmic sugar-binding protein [Klebsiella pneumoniae]